MKPLFLLLSLLLPCSALGEEITTLEWRHIARPTVTTLEWREYSQPPVVQLPGKVPEKLRILSHQSEDEATAATPQLRIVRCTDGTAAVQEYRGIEIDCPNGLDSCRRVEYWRTLPSAPGCYPLETARRLRDEEIAWRNRPPAPTVLEPVQVIHP